MKTIGIKLADGSFYPVLNEGTPSERLLQLTTAHNNQTKVMVDLYRSEIGSMEDAEYVDSLQIENLIEHPNGEPTLNFTVSIDENNRLSAKMIDNETGLQSNATITLVSRTLEERLLPDEYDIKDPTLEDVSLNEETSEGLSLTPTEENSLFGNTAEEEKVDDITTEESEPELDIEPDVVPDFDLPTDETSVEEPETEFEPETPEEPAETEETVEIKTPEISDFNPLDEPILEDDALSIDEFNTEEPDLSFDNQEDNMQNSDEDKTVIQDDADNTDFKLDLDLPDFNFSDPSEDSSSSDSTQMSDSLGDADLTENDNLSQTKTDSLTEESLDMDLDLPDFDDTSSTSEISPSDTIASDSSLDLDLPDFDTKAPESDTSFDLDLPDFDTPAADTTTTDTQDTSYLDDLDFDDLDDNTDTQTISQPSGKGLSFTGLYDKETAMGNSAANIEDERRNPKGAVIICILCAIICVLATIFVIMVIPHKFSLFDKKPKETAETEITVLPEISEPKESGFVEKLPEPEPSPAPEPVPQAKENEVVIIENAEDVVPLPPPVKPVKPKDITYRIKWGDTLWDISDTYYKNPWRYKYIARYNGIKNPDYIISGTFITIPAE